MSDTNLNQKLLEYWTSTQERCGVILDDGEVVELPNTHQDPANDFTIRAEDYEPYKERIVATWHTHPRTGPNLSVMDYMMFRANPNWYHYIASETEVWCYYVRNGKVILYEEENSIPRRGA